MKKEYLQPSMKVVKIKLTHIIASSPLPTSKETPTEWGAPEWDDDDVTF